jgi:hypothetical protein
VFSVPFSLCQVDSNDPVLGGNMDLTTSGLKPK